MRASCFVFLSAGVLVSAISDQSYAQSNPDNARAFQTSHIATAYKCYIAAFDQERETDRNLLAQAIKLSLANGTQKRRHDDFILLATQYVLKLKKLGRVSDFYKSECATPIKNIEKMHNDGMLRLSVVKINGAFDPVL